MPDDPHHLELPEDLAQAAEARALELGYASFDEYIAALMDKDDGGGQHAVMQTLGQLPTEDQAGMEDQLRQFAKRQAS